MASSLKDLTALRIRIRDEVESLQELALQFCQEQLTEFAAASTNRAPVHTLQGLREQRIALQHQFLDPTIELVTRRKPHRRVFTAFERFHRNRAEIVRLIPEVWTGSEFSGLAGSAPLLQWQKPRELELRRKVEVFLQKADRARAVLEDVLIVDMVGLVNLLLAAWERLSRRREEPGMVTLLQAKLLAQKTRLQTNLDSWDKLGQEEEKRFLAAMLKKPRAKRKENEAHRVLRGGVLRSLESDLALQQSFEKAWCLCLTGLENFHSSLLEEHSSLSQAKDQALLFLQEGGSSPETCYPANKIRIAPARSRCDEFSSSHTIAANVLPALLELIAVKKPGNSPTFSWTKLQPQRAFLDAFHAQDSALLEVAQEVISLHLSLFQEMERAHDVVNFALESSQQDHEDGLMDEALANAAKLLALFDQQRLDWVERAEKKWVAIFQEAVEEYYDRLGRDRLGSFRFILSKGGARGARSAWKLFQKTSRHGLAGLSRWRSDASERFLVGIGWKTIERAVIGVPEKRALLPEEYLRNDISHLPTIYQRLFKVEPLEDTRFLVSRSNEMQTLREAHSLWKAGRSAAVLLSGQRGSGKTSLLNCARLDVFQEERVRQIEPVERITTSDQLLAFLAKSLNLGSPPNIVESLREAGGVIVLEEVERLFLREVGGYEAIATLLDVVSQTQKRCLWILSINEVSLRLLERVIQLSGCFTHRVRASGVSSEALSEAILRRHNLSGLRIQFDRDSDKQGKRRLKRRSDAEQRDVFFQQLGERSSGVFRTALELWLGHIRLVEAGVLFMRPFQLVDSGPLLAELGQDDLFRLVAILQHGSIEPEELARVFSCSLATSRTALDELLGRELIESEPSRPGFRIRPEALPVVKEALYRKNLL